MGCLFSNFKESTRKISSIPCYVLCYVLWLDLYFHYSHGDGKCVRGSQTFFFRLVKRYIPGSILLCPGISFMVQRFEETSGIKSRYIHVSKSSGWGCCCSIGALRTCWTLDHLRWNNGAGRDGSC